MMAEADVDEVCLQLAENLDLGRQVSSQVLMGKIVADKPLLLSVVKSITSKIWNLRGALDISQKGTNLFLFSFELGNDRARVLEGALWTFTGFHIIFKEWRVGQAVEEIDFFKSPFWIHVHGLFPEQLTEEYAKYIGNLLGGFCDMDLTTFNGICHNDVMRIKASLWVERPLRPGFRTVKKDGSEQWVELKYERLPEFCRTCGRMGHWGNCNLGNGKFCSMAGPHRATEFGSWMRAETVDRGRREAKWRRGPRRNPVNTSSGQIPRDTPRDNDTSLPDVMLNSKS
ncbi:hypothetical protein Tsubulata_025614 [Turnera subulata]|uniref:DUF4283 domain-containing protein n=1 Tax=Turnera subulata TaxID=218843 RepID=A0A9Q0FLF6_9ROSI|nr:hypothetical protein Tsubulata_025614 [Turnera subulata]